MNGRGVLAIASVLLVVLVAWMYAEISAFAGHLVYAQDDPYIHLALARTLAATGTWGIAPGEFAPASSSPAWTILLALLWTVRIRSVEAPFWINVAGALLVLWTAQRCLGVLRRPDPPDTLSTVALLMSLVLVVPLPTLAFIGMEHTIQLVTVLAASTVIAMRLARHPTSTLMMGLSCGIAASVRYEFLLLAGVAVLLLLIRRDLVGAAAVLAGSAVPATAYALFATTQGGLIVPNSILMKSIPGRYVSVWSALTGLVADWRSIWFILERPAILMLFVAIALFVVSSASRTTRQAAWWLGILVLGTTILHVIWVKLDWFYRYDAYVVAMGLLALVSLAPVVRIGSAVPGQVLLVAVLIPLFVLRGLPALQDTTLGARNIFEQQGQMAKFFASHFRNEVVAVNDIGLVAWEGDVRVLDMAGLASTQVADLRRHRQWTTAALERVVRESGAVVVSVYGYPFFDFPPYPSSWTQVGTWRIDGNVAAAHDTVTFLAPEPRHVKKLCCSLHAFALDLPPSVSTTLERLSVSCP